MSFTEEAVKIAYDFGAQNGVNFVRPQKNKKWNQGLRLEYSSDHMVHLPEGQADFEVKTYRLSYRRKLDHHRPMQWILPTTGLEGRLLLLIYGGSLEHNSLLAASQGASKVFTFLVADIVRARRDGWTLGSDRGCK